MSTNKSYTKPDQVFYYPSELLKNGNKTYIHNSGWNFLETLKRHELNADKVLKKEITKSTAYIKKLVSAYESKEKAFIEELNKNKDILETAITKDSFQMFLNDALKNDPGIKAVYDYKYALHGKGGAAMKARKGITSRATANQKIIDAGLFLQKRMSKMDEFYLDKSKHWKNLDKEFNKINVFNALDLQDKTISDGLYKIARHTEKPLGNVFEQVVLEAMLGKGMDVKAGSTVKGFDLFVTEHEYGIEVKSNINNMLSKNIDGQKTVGDALKYASSDDQAVALYAIGNLLVNGMRIKFRTNKSGPLYIGFQLRLAIHLMEFVRAFEGSGFKIGKENTNVNGVMIITPTGMTYASDFFKFILTLLKSGDEKTLGKNIVGTQKFFSKEFIGKVGVPNMAAMRQDKLKASIGKTTNSAIYTAMSTYSGNPFGKINKDLRKLRFKLKYNIRMK